MSDAKLRYVISVTAVHEDRIEFEIAGVPEEAAELLSDFSLVRGTWWKGDEIALPDSDFQIALKLTEVIGTHRQATVGPDCCEVAANVAREGR